MVLILWLWVAGVSAVAATIFLGGWWAPILPGPHWLFIKMLVFLFFVTITLPYEYKKGVLKWV